MRRRDFILLLWGVVTWPLSARAQQSHRVRRVGVLHVVPGEQSRGFSALRTKLHELGYMEGRNIVFEYRWSDQAPRLPALAAELTGLRMEVIVTGDTATTFVAKKATKDIPIVAAVFNDDPVAAGLVGSLQASGWQPHRNKLARSRDEWQATGTASGNRTRPQESRCVVEPTGSAARHAAA